MKKKIVGIFVCMLLIVTALQATSIMNLKITRLVKENNYSESYTIIPSDSLGLITIKIVAQVKDVQDPDNLLGGAIKVGDNITGKYTYNSRVPDSEPYQHLGMYLYTSSIFGIEIKAGGLVFKTNPSDIVFGIAIGNDFFNIKYIDMYVVYSDSNLQLSNGMLADSIAWSLEDDTCTAFSSDALPTTAPILSDWTENIFYLIGSNPSDPLENYLITSTVTEATKSRIKDIYFVSQSILNWLLEHFANLFPILRQLIKL